MDRYFTSASALEFMKLIEDSYRKIMALKQRVSDAGTERLAPVADVVQTNNSAGEEAAAQATDATTIGSTATVTDEHAGSSFVRKTPFIVPNLN